MTASAPAPKTVNGTKRTFEHEQTHVIDFVLLMIGCLLTAKGDPTGTYASEPQRRVGISAFHFRACRSLDELRIFRVRPDTFKYGLAVQSETHKTPSTLQACSFFSNPLL